MAEKKIVSVDVDQLKSRVSNTALSALEGAKDKVQEAGQKLNDKAIGTIDKGIAMLQKARKNLK